MGDIDCGDCDCGDCDCDCGDCDCDCGDCDCDCGSCDFLNDCVNMLCPCCCGGNYDNDSCLEACGYGCGKALSGFRDLFCCCCGAVDILDNPGQQDCDSCFLCCCCATCDNTAIGSTGGPSYHFHATGNSLSTPAASYAPAAYTSKPCAEPATQKDKQSRDLEDEGRGISEENIDGHVEKDATNATERGQGISDSPVQAPAASGVFVEPNCQVVTFQPQLQPSLPEYS